MRRGAKGKPIAGAGTLSMKSWIDTGGASVSAYRGHITADGKNLYRFNDNLTISMYSRDTATGVITPLSTATVATGYNPFLACESPNGDFVYVACGGSDYIKPYVRNTTTGILTYNAAAAPNAATASGPTSIVISPDAKHVYTICRVANVVSQYSRNETTGALTALTPRDVALTGANGPRGLAMTRNATSGIAGKYAYGGNFNGSLVLCMVRDAGTGQLSPNPAQANIACQGVEAKPAFLVVSPDDKHLYVALDGTAKVAAFSINQADGSLTAIGEYSAGNGPWRVDLTPDGLHVYVANSDGQTISQYTREPSTGVLTAKVPAQVRSTPYFSTAIGSGGSQFIHIGPEGKHLYSYDSIGPWSLTLFDIHP